VSHALGNRTYKYHGRPGLSLGGTFNYGGNWDPLIFDETEGLIVYASTLFQTNEHLLQGDWLKGPAGSGEALWAQFPVPSLDILTGQLAESWELVDTQTMLFHIRKGVHFHDKPPTNGREMTAYDVVFSLKRLWESSQSYHSQVFPWDTHFESITAPDKWTVVFKSKPGLLGTMYECCSLYGQIVPREVVEKYGDMKDWKNSCGTGPFMLIDYIAGSAATLKKNPKYWQYDPLHSESRLPYVDSLKLVSVHETNTLISFAKLHSVLDFLRGVC